MVVTRQDATPLFTGSADLEIHTSINVDDDVHIDAHSNTNVIRIDHVLNDGKDVIAAFDKVSGAKTMHVNSAGDVFAGSRNLSDAIDDLELDINSAESTLLDHAALLVNATAEDSAQDNTLVKRDPSTGTKIDNLHVAGDSTGYTGIGNSNYPPPGLYFKAGLCETALDLIDDAQLSFTPYDAQGNAIVTKRFMFGRAQPYQNETIANADARRDGLLVEDSADGNSCEIMCSNELPTVRLEGIKAIDGNNDPVCPVLDVQDDQGTSRVALFDTGRSYATR